MIDLPVCYPGKIKKPNPKTLAEDVRRFGLILAAAGVVAGVLEGTNVLLSAMQTMLDANFPGETYEQK